MNVCIYTHDPTKMKVFMGLHRIVRGTIGSAAPSIRASTAHEIEHISDNFNMISSNPLNFEDLPSGGADVERLPLSYMTK